MDLCSDFLHVSVLFCILNLCRSSHHVLLQPPDVLHISNALLSLCFCFQAWLEGSKSAPTEQETRKKAFQWLLVLHNILRQWVSDKGLQHYCIVGNPDPFSWPLLMLTIDQGADGWSMHWE